jgi:hypothetical protein
MELHQGCRVFVLISVLLLSGCLGSRTTDIYNSYTAASMTNDIERLLKNTQFYNDKECMFVNCDKPTSSIDNEYNMKCVMKTAPGASMKSYGVDVRIVNDKINEIRYNGTLIT